MFRTEKIYMKPLDKLATKSPSFHNDFMIDPFILMFKVGSVGHLQLQKIGCILTLHTQSLDSRNADDVVYVV